MTFNQERYHRYEPRYEEGSGSTVFKTDFRLQRPAYFNRHHPQENKQTQTQTPKSNESKHSNTSLRRPSPRQPTPRQPSPRQPSPQRRVSQQQDWQYDEVVREQSHAKGSPYPPRREDGTQQREEREAFTEKKHDYRYDDRYYKEQGRSDHPFLDERSGAISNPYDANKGYLVLIRFRPQDISEFITAIQDTVSTINSHTGYVIGFAGPKDMKVLLSNPETIAKEQWWDTRDRGESRFAVCAMWFRDIYACKRWFESAPRIKQPDFPNSSPYQVIAVPLTFGQNPQPLQFDVQKEEITILWTEYSKIYERYENDFLVNYSEPARKCMKYYGGTPHISCCKYKPGWPAEANKFGQPGYARTNVQNERCARAIRTGWVDPDTFMTVSTFPSMDDVNAFYNDSYYQRVQTILGRYSHPTSVAITLQKVRGTSRP